MNMDVRDCIFWGKFKNDSDCLPLVCHCLDVALAFHALTDLPAIRRALERAGGRSLDERDRQRLAVLAFLHDVGKANLGFQYKVFPHSPFQPAGHVAELGMWFHGCEKIFWR